MADVPNEAPGVSLQLPDLGIELETIISVFLVLVGAVFVFFGSRLFKVRARTMKSLLRGAHGAGCFLYFFLLAC